MAPEPNEREPFGPEGPVPNFEEALSNLTNPDLLSALDIVLLELEKRLYRYPTSARRFLRWPTRGWFWPRGRGRGWSKPSPLPSTPKTTCG
jgi:hypothetical protein